MEAEIEFMQSVDVGLVVVVEEVEMVGGRAKEIRGEEEVIVATGETAVEMVSLELGGGDVVFVTDEAKGTELVEVTEVES